MRPLRRNPDGTGLSGRSALSLGLPIGAPQRGGGAPLGNVVSSSQPDAAGPDLALGIPVDDLADGRMVAGHVGKEGVLLARRGNEYFAIGAVCSHYSGPLAEGIMVEDTVRCPWHHACF